ncbi:MAG: hypothetical protein ACWGMZ_02310 [Thermoguttaceae bacterium]
MTPDDELKSAWKAQPLPRQITINADVLLQQIRGNKARFTSSILWGEGFMILGWVVMAFGFIGFSIWRVRLGAPWEAMSGLVLLGIILLAIAAYKALDRFRQMRRVSLSAPVLACAEESLALVRHEIQLWTNVLWWYLLPLVLGMEAAVLAIVCTVEGVHGLVNPIALNMLGILVIITLGGWWICRWYVHTYYQPRRQELEALVRELKSQ